MSVLSSMSVNLGLLKWAKDSLTTATTTIMKTNIDVFAILQVRPVPLTFLCSSP